MAIRVFCDGACGDELTLHQRDARHDDNCEGCRLGHDGTVRGLLDSAHFCRSCAKTFDDHEHAERSARVEAVQKFEAWRRDARAELRKTFKKLPDDWDAPAEEKKREVQHGRP